MKSGWGTQCQGSTWIQKEETMHRTNTLTAVF